MTALEAWEFRQWVLSFTVGDIINLLFAVGTIGIAFMAYRIQRAQKKFIEAQTQVLQCQHEWAEEKKRREDYEFKRTVLEHTIGMQMVVMEGEGNTDDEASNFFALNSHLLKDYFEDSYLKLIDGISKIYNSYEQACMLIDDPQKKKAALDDFQNEMKEYQYSFFILFAGTKY